MHRLLALAVVLAPASLCLAAAPEKKPPAIPDLIWQLSSDDAAVREEAAQQLGKLGLASRDAVPALAKALHDPAPPVRKHAAKALAAIGVPAVPTLIDALQDPTIRNHAQIANALAWIGPPAGAAVPILAELLKRPEDGVRALAALAASRLWRWPFPN